MNGEVRKTRNRTWPWRCCKNCHSLQKQIEEKGECQKIVIKSVSCNANDKSLSPTCWVLDSYLGQIMIPAAVLPASKPSTKKSGDLVNGHIINRHIIMHALDYLHTVIAVRGFLTCPDDFEWDSGLLTGSSNLVPRASATALFLVSPLPVLTFKSHILEGIFLVFIIFEQKILNQNTDLFLQFIEQLLVELPLSKSLSLTQLIKMILQLLLLVVPFTRGVLLVGDHVADVVTQLRVDKHPVMYMVMI